jgi:hypothetical protein
VKASSHGAFRPRPKTLNRPTKSAIAFGLIASLLMSSARVVLADAGPASAPSGEQQKAEAKAKYEQGVEAFRNERYADAVRLFLAADALAPSAALSFNVARAYENLADEAATLRWYRNYLRLDPQGPKGDEVRESIKKLSEALASKGIQQLTVLSTPAGATVSIDDQALGVTPLTVELRPGAHHVLLTLRGYADAARSFTLEAATPMDLPLELTDAPSVLPSSAPAIVGVASSAPPKHDTGPRFGVVPWIALGAGAAALGGAAVFEARRRSAQNAALADHTQVATQDDLDTRNSRQTTARVLLGVGGVLVATGAVLLVFNLRSTPRSQAVITSRPGGATLSLERSF